ARAGAPYPVLRGVVLPPQPMPCQWGVRRHVGGGGADPPGRLQRGATHADVKPRLMPPAGGQPFGLRVRGRRRWVGLAMPRLATATWRRDKNSRRGWIVISAASRLGF